MDFNIKKILEKKQQQTPGWKDKKICCDVLSMYRTNINPMDINLQKGILFLEKLEPQQRTFIKLYKKDIISLIKEKGVYLRDIL